jgi:hypothetical protein
VELGTVPARCAVLGTPLAVAFVPLCHHEVCW